MPVSKPGDYITAKCGRCNDITGHVVMLVLDGAITKVECKACGSVHKYRDTTQKAPKKPQGTAVRRVRAGQGRDTATEIRPPRLHAGARTGEEIRSAARASGQERQHARKSPAKTETAWREAMARHSGETPALYSMQNSYALQELVEHPIFGLGEVIAVVRPDKVDILFQEGVKTLRCRL